MPSATFRRCIKSLVLLSAIVLLPWRVGDYRTAATLSAAGDVLTVLQWNTYHGGYGTDNVFNPDRQVSWIVSREVDIISLNEVKATDAANFKTKIEARTGVTWYSHHVPAQSDGTGNQILSRYPFLSTSTYRMQTNGTYARAVAQATIDVAGRAVNVFSTHLDDQDDAIRSAQVKELETFMSGFAEPRIVAGDLNATPEQGSLQTLNADYVDTWSEAVSSSVATAYPPDNPADASTRTHRSRIDYVLYSEWIADVAATSGTVPDTRDLTNTNVQKLLGTTDDKGVRPSDHNPLWVTFEFRSSTDATPPSASILQPVDGAAVSGIVRVVVSTSDDHRVNDVRLKVDGSVVATDSSSPFEFAWNSAGITSGSHTLVAVARDPSGNLGESAPVTVDVQPTAVTYGEVVLHAGEAPVLHGSWAKFADATAAGGVRVAQPDRGAAKISTALASPVDYFDMTFSAEAGRPYHLWLRGKAENDSYNNDSVHVQFSDSVDGNAASVYRIGTTSSAPVVLEDCNGCGLSGWGWQDNGYGAGVLGPVVYFAGTGTHTVRIQAREDGLSIDQIVVSPDRYLLSAPGTLKKDTTILPASSGMTSSVTSNALPVVTLTSPAAGTTAVAPATFTVTANASDSDGTIQRVDFYAGTTQIGSATSSPYSIAWTTSAAGTYTLTAVAIDNAGGSTTSTGVTIEVTSPANAAPVVTLTSPAAGTTAIAPATFTVTANASDSDGTIQRVDFYAGTTQIGSATSSPYSITWTTSATGTYTLTAVALDNAGASTTSAGVTIDVTAPANAPPVVTLTSPSPGTSAIAPATFTVTANASDSDGTIQRVDFYAGTTQIGTATSSPYSITWTTSTAGTYTLTAVAIDNAGASRTSATVDVVVTAPAITPTISLTATGTKVKGVQRVDLSWTGATSAQVDVFRNSVRITVTANDGAYTDNLNRKGSGTYEYKVCEAGTSTCSAGRTVVF